MNTRFWLVGTLYLFFLANGLNGQEPLALDYSDKIEKSLLQEAGGATKEFIILFKEQADLSAARGLKSKEEKGKFVYDALRQKALETQGRVIAELEQSGVFFQPYFLVNMIHVEGTELLMHKLASFPEVQLITPNPMIKIEFPVSDQPDSRGPAGVEWGIQKIQADQVWNLGVRGQGVVVGGQDTGYEWFHPALKQQYRGYNGVDTIHDYHWHDAIKTPINGTTNPCGYDSKEPCDDHLHGTHTMGTMVGEEGDNLIGVAPEARWIGCRNMDKGYGTPVTYIECFEWFLAPTDIEGNNPDPLMAPHVINNSWSCPESEGCFPSNYMIMETAVNNLRLAGVVVVVSAGNEGGQCATINRPPAIFKGSFAIGATDIDDLVAGFSSRGPVFLDSLSILHPKPDVTAPGVFVRSSMLNGSYGAASGTSMAGPHVAGLVALIISANPALAGQVDTIEQIIRETAIPISSDQECGTIPAGVNPNNIYGFGRIDALQAVNKAMEFVSDLSEAGQQLTEVRVYPNPFQRVLYIDRSGDRYAAEFYLFNSQGQLVYSNQVPGKGQQKITLPGLSAGYYFYQMISEKGYQTGTLIRQ